MIKVENLSYSFPDKDLYNNISFTLEEGDHCAFIGTSGSGKSTLVDMIMNPDDYIFDGKMEKESNCRIGYVSQFSGLDETKDQTVFEYIAENFIYFQNEIASICTQMETATDLDNLLLKYQETLDAYEAIGGDDYENIIRKNLNLANLSKHENLPVKKLSGGEFKLVQVIKEMLANPDLMIMDEPDAFLDFENINSLKNLINSHKGIMLVITHNRYLLNHCFNKIIHLENKELQEFNGRYVEYNLALLEKKIELQELAAADDAEIARQEAIINRYRNAATVHTEASRGKALKARVSLLERLEARRIKAPFVEIKEPNIDLGSNIEVKEEEIVLSVTNYKAAFDELLLDNVNFEIKSTDKVAIIGPNGTGKTTLLRDIFKNSKASIHIPEDVKVAFLSQLQSEMLNESNKISDEFLEAGFTTYDEIKEHLIKYGFDENIMNQKIGSLSGGEKNLLQLAKVEKSKANLLLLDEPTSHLDTFSQMALEKAINKYQGAVLMISHDFYTIVNCVDYVLIIEDKTIRRMSIRKFRKMIYEKHFNKDYLELEQKKNALETKIALVLKNKDFEEAKVLVEELETLIPLL